MTREWVTTANGAIAVARLERAANALARAAHPGVVEVVAYTATGLEAAELRTVRFDAPTLADRPLPPEELAGVVAAVATTLADLHTREVTHGAVEARHILVPGGSAPRLCGFSGDPAARPEDDVAALGRMVEIAARANAKAKGDALEELRADLPRRGRGGRGGRARGRARRPARGRGRVEAERARSQEARRAMSEIAQRATDPDPTRRPSAHEVAAMLRDRVPGARLPSLAPAAGPAGGRRRGDGGGEARGGAGSGGLGRGGAGSGRPLFKRLAFVVVPVLGAAVLVIGAMVPGRSLEIEPAPEPTSTTAAGATAVQLWPDRATGCDDSGTTLRGDVDGDGCDDPLAFHEGVLISDSGRLAVGSAGDVAVTGDWDCDGRTTLVLLRPARGTVWHFATWPPPGRSVEGRLVAEEAGAVDLVARAHEEHGCDQLEVGLADGGRITVAVAPEVAVDRAVDNAVAVPPGGAGT